MSFKTFLSSYKLFKTCKNLFVPRNLSCKRQIILGIETSCDDTGCAVVDNFGNILGESLYSQQSVHLNLGGIIPPVAQSLHRDKIEEVVDNAVNDANITFNDITAIAATVKPGLPLSLVIGMKYGKYLCKKYNKPFIPIHHMEAHALTARMFDSTIEYPFLCLLISGGHCLLTVVKSVDEYILLGQSLDDAPGEAFDKTARRLKLRNLPEFRNLSGGQAIELAASKADNLLKYNFTLPLSKYRDCNFSMAGLKNRALRLILKEEKQHNIEADGIIPEVYELCASFQLAITRHLCHRTQRAMEYISMKNLLPENKKTLVVSGGAACNNFIAKALQIVCNEMDYKFVRPPPKLCTDNGIMIAWNGVERWIADKGVTTDLNSIDIEAKASLGVNICEDVRIADIKCKWIKLSNLVDTNDAKIVKSAL